MSHSKSQMKVWIGGALSTLLILILASSPFGPFTVPPAEAAVNIAPRLIHPAVTRTTQIFMGRGGLNTINATRWIPLNQSVQNTSAEATTTEGIMPLAGTFGNLNAYVSSAPGGATSWVVTLSVNGSLKASTCTITSAITSCSDLSNTVAISAGDLVSVKFAATGGTPVSAYLYYSIQFTPTTANQTAWFPTNGTGNNTSATEETYTPLSTVNSVGPLNAEANQSIIMPEGGTFSNLYIAPNLTVAPGTFKMTVKNQSAGATTSITCTLSSAAACSDTVNTYATSSPAAGVIGDLMDIASQPASSPTARTMGGGIVFTPTTAGNFVYTSYFPADSATVEEYVSRPPNTNTHF